MVELLIQRTLVSVRQMTVIRLTHLVFFIVDSLKIAAIRLRLGMRDLSVPALGIDTPLLVVHTAVHLVYPGMVLQMCGLMTGTLRKRRRRDQ